MKREGESETSRRMIVSSIRIDETKFIMRKGSIRERTRRTERDQRIRMKIGEGREE
jgi:hypothetical protein